MQPPSTVLGTGFGCAQDRLRGIQDTGWVFPGFHPGYETCLRPVKEHVCRGVLLRELW
jgi:hypothetical protein